MSDKYAALKQAAENATPGEWVMSNEYYLRIRDSEQNIIASAGYANERQEMMDATFIAAANPATILELLAERDADKARIAELESGVKAATERYENRTPTEWAYTQACAALEKHRSRAEVADARVAELEARTLTVKLPDCDYGAVQHMSGGSDDYCNGFVDGTQNAIKALTKDCAAAGISLKIEGE